MGQAMETVAPHTPTLTKGCRQWVFPCDGWDIRKFRRVEARNLRRIGAKLRSARSNPLQRHGIMEGGQMRSFRDLCFDCRVDPTVFGLPRTAMHDTMCDQARRTLTGVLQEKLKQLHGRMLVRIYVNDVGHMIQWENCAAIEKIEPDRRTARVYSQYFRHGRLCNAACLVTVPQIRFSLGDSALPQAIRRVM